ncbi:MAG: hypothetical protein HY548_03205 [Elusimicrobia bacterium]|nr:hypothetical protein [Elusimicrobiota bacterium]
MNDWEPFYGFLPLLFFAGMVWTHRKAGKVAESLWMCHVSNLFLAAGMVFHQPLLIRAAIPWLIVGVPLWIIDMWRVRMIIPASVVSHLGGITIGLLALKRAGTGPSMWMASFVFYLLIQFICRWITPRRLNVNLAHRVYDGVKPYFPDYRTFWISVTSLTAIVLWSVEQLLIAFI